MRCITLLSIIPLVMGGCYLEICNDPPAIAAMGEDQVVKQGEWLRIECWSSGGCPETYQWTQDSGPAKLTIAEPENGLNFWRIPEDQAVGVYVLRFTVTNSRGAASDTLTVTVLKSEPSGELAAAFDAFLESPVDSVAELENHIRYTIHYYPTDGVDTILTDLASRISGPDDIRRLYEAEEALAGYASPANMQALMRWDSSWTLFYVNGIATRSYDAEISLSQIYHLLRYGRLAGQDGYLDPIVQISDYRLVYNWSATELCPVRNHFRTKENDPWYQKLTARLGEVVSDYCTSEGLKADLYEAGLDRLTTLVNNPGAGIEVSKIVSPVKQTLSGGDNALIACHSQGCLKVDQALDKIWDWDHNSRKRIVVLALGSPTAFTQAVSRGFIIVNIGKKCDPVAKLGGQPLEFNGLDGESQLDCHSLEGYLGQLGSTIHQRVRAAMEQAEQLEPPTFFPNGGSLTGSIEVTIQACEGAWIKYTTDDSEPTEENGSYYNGPILLTQTTTIKAKAFTDEQESSVASATFTINPTQTAATPTFNPNGGSFTGSVDVSVSCTTAGATIRYTTDGSTPASSYGTVYSSPVHLTQTTTLKAIAYMSGMADSSVASATFTANMHQGPRPRVGNAMAYDSYRGLSIIHGGGGSNSDACPGCSQETWAWNGVSWLMLGSNGPFAFAAGMAFDSSRNTCVLVEGNETWELTGNSWTLRDSSSLPNWLVAPPVAYDSNRQRIVVFGGYTGEWDREPSTWEWNGLTWTEGPLGIVPRQWSSLAFDSNRKVCVMYGGIEDLHDGSGTWEYNGVSWIERENTSAPGSRCTPAMAFDPARGVTVLYGGQYNNFETWTWDGSNWSLKATTGPQVNLGTMVYDNRRGLIVYYGGAVVPPPPQEYYSDFRSEVWEWNGSTWTQR